MSSTETPVARSPISPPDPVVRDGWEVSARRSTAELTLVDETPLTKILIRGPFDGALRDVVGTGFGRAARTEQAGANVLAIGSGPGEWLVIGVAGTGDILRSHLEATTGKTKEFVSVVDLTHGRALMRLQGRRSADVLGKLCGIDLHDDSVPNGAALRTSVAGIATDLVRDDDGAHAGGPSYLLHCERSSGQYLFDALLDAGTEFGIEVTGPLEGA